MYDAANRFHNAMYTDEFPGGVDFIEAGAGSLVLLVHSSMAGARQWSTLIEDLRGRYRVRAINLFGYGKTPGWPGARSSSLEDFAELVAQTVPDRATNISLVGHSIGGAVAMQAAARQLRGRVSNLVLIEPSLFYLLDHCGHREAFHEISTLAEYTRQYIRAQKPHAAAERFIDYWCGPGTWAQSPPERKFSFTQSVALLMHEWEAVLRGNITPAEWAMTLPRRTLVMSAARTTRPSREIVEILLGANPDWEFASVRDGGHMAPLTNARAVNPVIRNFLNG